MKALGTLLAPSEYLLGYVFQGSGRHVEASWSGLEASRRGLEGS